MTKIQILNYGSGNLFSIENSIKKSFPSVEVTIGSEMQGEIDGLILPGVGSFSSAQGILLANRAAILEGVKSRKLPLLGICLGMQLLFEKSEEGPGQGLKFFHGNVKAFSSESKLKVPHLGWNTLCDVSKDSVFCNGLKSGEWVYYAHSFYPVPEDRGVVKAWTRYGDEEFPSIIESQNIFGTQFHPEKSGRVGARLVSNFVSICEDRDRRKSAP